MRGAFVGVLLPLTSPKNDLWVEKDNLSYDVTRSKKRYCPVWRDSSS